MGDLRVERKGGVDEACERKEHEPREEGRALGAEMRGRGEAKETAARRVLYNAPRMSVIETRNMLRLQSPAPGGWNLRVRFDSRRRVRFRLGGEGKHAGAAASASDTAGGRARARTTCTRGR